MKLRAMHRTAADVDILTPAEPRRVGSRSTIEDDVLRDYPQLAAARAAQLAQQLAQHDPARSYFTDGMTVLDDLALDANVKAYITATPQLAQLEAQRPGSAYGAALRIVGRGLVQCSGPTLARTAAPTSATRVATVGTDDELLDAKAHELMDSDPQVKALHASGGFSPAFRLAMKKADKLLSATTA